jgi:predicted DsbA family dithiol-disulfide isomerase
MAGPVRIDIVADVVCPWCFIGHRRLARAMAMRPKLRVARIWRPFQLNPELPREGLPRELYLRLNFGVGRSAARIHAALATAGAKEGIEFAFDRIGRTPNTLDAHRLVRLAAESGRADAVVDALFRGYFEEGLDIGDLDALAAVAASSGLDASTARAHLAGGAGTREVLAEEQRARRIGVDAVPCFIIAGDYALAGAQDPEMFLPLFDLALVPQPA